MKTINKFFSPKNIIRGLFFVLLAISLFIYRDFLGEIFGGIRLVTTSEICISVLLAGAGYLLEGLTIACMEAAVRERPFRQRARNGIFIAFVCEFYRLATLGNGSGFAEIYYLHSRGIESGRATALTMIQYVLKRIAIAMLGILGFVFLGSREDTRIFYEEYSVFIGLGCFITATVILLFLCLALSDEIASALLRCMEWAAGRIPFLKKGLVKWEEQIVLLNQSGKTVLVRKKEMLYAVLLQTGKLLLIYSIPVYLLLGKTVLGAEECLCIMALSFMLAGVIPAPSGAGSLEFTFLLFFAQFSAHPPAISALLVFRFATWLCPAAAGGILLLGSHARSIVRKRGKSPYKLL